MQTNFKFRYFGPLLVEANIDENFNSFSREVVDLSYKNGTPFEHTISGLEDEWELEKTTILPKFNEYMQKYIHGYREVYWNQWMPGRTRDDRYMYVNNAWVNYQRPREYRDPHTHTDCDLSFVIYYDVPQVIRDEKSNQAITSSTPGSITFTGELSRLRPEEMFHSISEVILLPEPGTIVIFPWYLQHRVAAFKSDCTRITIAGNIIGER